MKTTIFLILAWGTILISFANDSIVSLKVYKPSGSFVVAKLNPYPIETLDSEAAESYTWLTNMQLPNGLLESTEGANFVSLYDNSLAALAFLSQGDIKRAEMIFDFFNARIESELMNTSGGFYQFRDAEGNNARTKWLGDNAWLLIALNNYEEITGNNRYQRMASELEKWIRSLQDTDGGLWGGTRENGNQIHKITEGIITAFNAVKGFDDFHEGILGFIKAQRWDANEQVLVAQPDFPKYNFALDLYTLGFLIMEDLTVEVLHNADKFLNTQKMALNGEVLEGYCFDEDKDVIWLEGTAQMALAYKVGGMKKEAKSILNNLEKTFIPSVMMNNVTAIPYATNQGTSFETSNLYDNSCKVPALSPNVWYIFAKSAFNPFQLGKNKKIPAELKFWVYSSVN
jgi:hypothetical protein